MPFSLRLMRSVDLDALLGASEPRETTLGVLKDQQLENRGPQIVTFMHSPRLTFAFDLLAFQGVKLHYSTW